MRLDKLISSLGYCSRSEVRRLLDAGRIAHISGKPLKFSSAVEHSEIIFDGEVLDPPEGSVWMLHKPDGYVCSRTESEGPSVYSLFPERYRNRRPPISTVGRLDRDATGLLLLTDDGQIIHRLTSPSRHVPKVYEVILESPVPESAISLFASGTLLLPEEEKPCLPAILEMITPLNARLTIEEGRYHQVKRMFEAVGTQVTRLHRLYIGKLELGDLIVGQYRLLTKMEVELAACSREDVKS